MCGIDEDSVLTAENSMIMEISMKKIFFASNKEILNFQIDIFNIKLFFLLLNQETNVKLKIKLWLQFSFLLTL